MPEGDTAWRAARRLHETLTGQILLRTDIRVPRYATVDFSGNRVDEVVSRGKHLLLRAEGTTLRSHLKMEGRWDTHERGSRWRQPPHAARVVLQTTTHEAVGFWLAKVAVVATSDEAELVGHLGPDLLGPDWNADTAVQRLSARPDRPVFLALLDQRNLAGLGNEYVNELLFIRGLLPSRPVGEVADLPGVVQRAYTIIHANRDRSRRTFTGINRPGQERWVYGRDRATCRRCSSPIQRGRLGDLPTQARNTYCCPTCQT